ncbi:Protein of unknown function [Gryllus bimaculatus]|nr:Protein of unknown function [Gryllus bimaculatus]
MYAQTTRLYGTPPGSGASGCTRRPAVGPNPRPPPPPPPSPPPGTCPGARVCQGADTCGAQQGSDDGDAKPQRAGLVDFETLLKDYAFYDEVDKRILNYNGDKKKAVRFAPGTKKDPSDSIYSHDLKSVIDYEHREDDCTESFWGCLVGDLVADVLSESSNETKELVEEVIQTLEVAQEIGHVVLDHLQASVVFSGHPDKQHEEESFDAKRKRKKTNYPFLPPVTEETCPGCSITEESSQSQGADDATSVLDEGDECQKVGHRCCGGDEPRSEPQAAVEEPAPAAFARCGDACGVDDLIQEATPQTDDAGCADTCGVGEEAVEEAAPEAAADVGSEGGGCDCDASVSKSCPYPAKRCLVSAERKSRDNYPFLEDKSKAVFNCGPVNACKSSYDKAKVVITKHAGGVMSAVMDSHQTIDKVQKAIFAKANHSLSNALTNLTKTAEKTEEVTKIALGKSLKLSEESLESNDTANKDTIANYTLKDLHREENSQPEFINVSTDVNAVKGSIPQEQSDSLLPNRHIISNIAEEQSAIASQGGLEATSKLTATNLSSLQNIADEADVSRKSPGQVRVQQAISGN